MTNDDDRGSNPSTGSANTMRLLAAAMASAVDDDDVEAAAAIRKIINERSAKPKREPTISSDAMDWIDGLVRRFSDKVYSLAFRKCEIDGTYRATIAHAREAAAVVIESACDYFDQPPETSRPPEASRRFRV